MKKIINALFIFAFICSIPATNGECAKKLLKGEVNPSVACKSNSGQSYALYLPKKYDSSRTWPIIYGFSPNGIGSEPVEAMKNIAEKYGFIVVGSNNAKNGPWEDIQKAIKVLVKDTDERFNLQGTRRYAVGFSGGARMCFYMANKYSRKLRGIIPCGAGFGEDKKCPKNIMIYGFCGADDKNLSEMNEACEKLGWPKNKKIEMEVFPGDHRWPPEALLEKALRWLDKKAEK